MDRLTVKMNDGTFAYKVFGEYYSIHALATLEVGWEGTKESKKAFEVLSEIDKRFTAYEELGLSPEQLKEISKLYLEKCEEVNKLNAELAKLKKKLPPCNMGDTVYRYIPETGEVIECEMCSMSASATDEIFEAHVKEKGYSICFRREHIGEEVFLSETDLKAKMEEMGKNE